MDNSSITIKYRISEDKEISVEVSLSVKELLEQSDRQIRSQRRQDRRHLDFFAQKSENWDCSLTTQCKDTADLLIMLEQNNSLQEHISKLTKVQQRRLRLHFFAGLTYSQIASIENVSHSAVIYSIEQALKKLRTYY